MYVYYIGDIAPNALGPLPNTSTGLINFKNKSKTQGSEVIKVNIFYLFSLS